MNPKNTLLTTILICLSVFVFAQDYWQYIETTPDSSPLRCIAINPEGDIYIGMHGFDYPGGIYRSTDEAQTWEYLGLSDLPVFTIEFVPNGDIIAGVEDGMYKSNDNGASWYEVYFELENVFEILALPNGYVFAGGGGNLHGILRSTDFGETWDTNYVFPSTVNENLHALAISFEGYIYAGSKSIFGAGGIYKTTDLGNSWEEIDYPGYQARSLAFHPSGDLFAGSVSQGLFRYNFNTQQWTQPVNWVDIEDIFFIGYDKIFLGCLDSPNFLPGVLFSNDGGQSFDWLNSGLWNNGVDIYNIIRHPDGFIYANSLTLYRSVEPVLTNIEHIYKLAIATNYPNPFTDFTTIQWDNSGQDKYIKLIITDVSGNIIHTKVIENKGYFIYNNILSKPGILFYSVVGKNNTYSGKMVLVK